MNVVIENVDVNVGIKICEKDNHIYLQPTFDADGAITNLVDVVINDVCSIKQVIDSKSVQMVTSLGHIIMISYTDYGFIRIM